MPRCSLVAAALLSIGLCACARQPANQTGAYVAALRSVRPDVVGELAAGPLYLEPQLLPSDSGAPPPRQSLDSTVIRELLAKGLVQAPCRPGAGPTATPCLPARGLYVAVSTLARAGHNRYALVVHVAGRAVPTDNTVIVGSGYTARLILEQRDRVWTVKAKARTSPLMRAT
jgi:hypothetical protein